MKVVQRKPAREEKKPQVPMWVPAWIKNGLCFEPGDDISWLIMEDDDGKRFGALILTKKEGEDKGEGEEKKGEEGGKN